MSRSWESIVKITNRLAFIKKDRPISEQALVTFLTEAEATLSTCPLTQLSEDINDFNVITPNHFILGKHPLYFSLEMIMENHVT